MELPERVLVAQLRSSWSAMEQTVLSVRSVPACVVMHLFWFDDSQTAPRLRSGRFFICLTYRNFIVICEFSSFMLDIHTEFKRLREFTTTDAGWDNLNTAWMMASNYRRQNGEWCQIGGSGSKVIGFAIDPITWRFEIGAGGEESHKAPWFFLTTSLQHSAQSSEECRDIDRRVLEGRLAPVEGWAYPLATIVDAIRWHRRDPSFLMLVEYQILKLGIGLPISGITIAREVRPRA